MTKTVLIEGLIEILKGIASKVEANPSGSHLVTDVEGERGSGGELVAVLNNAAKKTALTSCSVDYTYKVDGTPSVAEPSIISVIGNQLGLVMLDADEVEEHKMYQINLGRPSGLDDTEDVAGGHIDVKNGIVTVTHVRRILSPIRDDWEKDGDNDGSFYAEIHKIKPDSEFVCNMGEWVAPANYASGKVTTDNDVIELWLAPSGATVDEWKEFIRTNRVDIVYELETPIVYSIEPTEIKTLNCYNNVLVAYQEYVTTLNVTYTRDESKAIEALEQQGGGGFAPTLLGTFSGSQAAGTDLEISDCSGYGWLIVEFEKPNESMAGYNGPFRKTIWIPTDSMTQGSTQEVGIAYNEVSATSMAVTAILPMISIKDSTHVHIVAAGNFNVSRVFGV